MNTIENYKVTHIVNFAAQGMVAESWESPDQWIRTNVLSLSYLLKDLHKIDHIKSFVQASTPEVYGVCHNALESHNYAPSTPYAASKAAADALLHAYSKTHGFPVRYTRASNVYGGGQQLYRIVPKTIFTILNKGKLSLHGGGHSVRSFVHINDVSIGTYKVACSGHNGEIYHVAGTQLVSIRDLVYAICQLMDVAPEEYLIEGEQRTGSDSLYQLNADKINRELSWRPSVILEQGLEEVIFWVKENFEILKHISPEYVHKQ